MDCVVGLLLMMLGVVLFAYGRVPFATLEARGVLVRVAGAVLFFSPLLYLLAAFLIGVAMGAHAAQDNRVDQEELKEKAMALFNWVWLVWYAVTLALAFLLVAVSFRSAEVRVKKRRYYDEDGNYIRDDDEDRPRRKRRRHRTADDD